MASTQFTSALRQSARCARSELHRSIFSSQFSSQCRFASTTASTEPFPPISQPAVQEKVIKERRRVTKHPAKPKKVPEAKVAEDPATEALAEQSKVHLPHMDKWRKFFHITKEVGKRVSLRNPESSKILADAFVPAGSKDRVVIEASPGPLFLVPCPRISTEGFVRPWTIDTRSIESAKRADKKINCSRTCFSILGIPEGKTEHILLPLRCN